MATVELKNINKIYDNNVQAVFDFNLKIKDREFIVFVGPSGCGKTTTLRMVAGLEEITSGQLLIDDEVMNDVAPKDRNIAMVFQSYALYPHMTVYDNMAFGLKLRKFSRDEIDRRVQNAAEKLGLKPYLDRKPAALSGGQRQRVALGRAIVRDAKVFLMDEPLSNLDAKLRVQMRSELIKIHESLGTTTIYVTHDQIEAMTMASRIVVMKDGWIQQIGAPKDIYDNPANVFVGGFIGTPPMNFINGRVGEDGIFECGNQKFGVVRLAVPEKQLALLKEKNFIEKDIILGIRPEAVFDSEEDMEKYPQWVVERKVDVSELLGAESQITVKLPGTDRAGQNLTAKVPARVDVHMGDTIRLALNMNKCHFFDPETQVRIKRD
jgi:multiple sugar transport system ATP-binding protein